MQPQLQPPHVASVAIHASLAPALKNVWLTSSFWSVYLWTFLLRWIFFCYFVYFFFLRRVRMASCDWMLHVRIYIIGSGVWSITRPSSNYRQPPALKTYKQTRKNGPSFSLQIRREKFAEQTRPPREPPLPSVNHLAQFTVRWLKRSAS